MPVVSAGGATLNSHGSNMRCSRQKSRRRKGEVTARSMSALESGWSAMVRMWRADQACRNMGVCRDG